MLYSANMLKGCSLQAKDGQIGKIDEFYFDDGSWQIRYLVVDVGNWLKRQRVLIIPETVTAVDPEDGAIGVGLTKEEVKNSPDALEQTPVSRQMEVALHRHYNWTPYWDVDPVGVGSFGHESGTIVQPYNKGVKADVEVAEDATTFADQETQAQATATSEVAEDVPAFADRESQAQAATMLAENELAPSGRLRSSLEVRGYHIQALDGEIGHISDFLINGSLDEINYLVVDTSNWLPGKKVAIPPTLVQAIHWDGSKADVALTKEQLKNGPEYGEDTDPFITGGYERELQEYYARKTLYM